MFKRSIYVIISSLIAASAAWAWTQDVTLPNFFQPAAPQHNVPQAPKPNREILNYHHVILSTLQADDTIVNSELQLLAANDAVRAPLAHADEKDEFKQSAIEKAFKTLTEDKILQTALVRAIINANTSEIIAASSPETATALLQSLQPAEGKLQPAGLIHRIQDGMHTRIAWHCLNEEATYCMLVQLPITITLPEHLQCTAANNIFVTCTQGHVDTTALFKAENCPINTDRKAVHDEIMQQTILEGTFEVNTQTYEFKKSNTNNGYTVATVVSIPKAAPAPVVDNKTLETWTKPQSMGIAGGAFALMALLGWLCIRRREEKDTKTAALSHETLNTIKEECAKAKAEKESLKKQLETLETNHSGHESKIKDLETQLDFAKKAYKKEQITRMSLEQEKQQLEDALASSKISQHTAIENISHFADHSASLSDIPKLYDNQENKDGNFNRITAPAKPEQLEALASEKSQSFFDALTDDTWDDIADSFDAIFTPNRKTEDAPKTPQHISTSMLTNEPIDNHNDISTSFINSLSTSDTRVVEGNEPEKAKPIIRKSTPSITAAPAVSKSIPTLNAVSKNSINGVAAIQGTAERQIMPSAHDLAVKKSTASSNESFKPAPSWTGKKVTDTGMDQNALYDALKRRARDVSEMAMPAAGTAKSGVFDFNIGLSKSGVFSVTGSRVDIDPLSDTEYFKSLYEKYIETQKQCGESTNKFTLEQFVSRLAREKERLMQTHNCRNVRFTVYVKEGKASLKATPQK